MHGNGDLTTMLQENQSRNLVENEDVANNNYLASQGFFTIPSNSLFINYAS